MRHPDHLVIAFHKQRRNRERRAFEASEAVFDVVLVAIFLHPLLQRQALLWGIAGIGAPAQRRDDLSNHLLVVLDRRDLIAHPLAHLRLPPPRPRPTNLTSCSLWRGHSRKA